jgi:hypothetical protein
MAEARVREVIYPTQNQRESMRPGFRNSLQCHAPSDLKAPRVPGLLAVRKAPQYCHSGQPSFNMDLWEMLPICKLQQYDS